MPREISEASEQDLRWFKLKEDIIATIPQEEWKSFLKYMKDYYE